MDTIHQFGGSWDKDFTQREVDLIFEAARDQGVNLIDTAECYGDHQAESLVGGSIRRELERRGLREFFLEVRRGDETGSLKELKGKFPGTVLFAGYTEYGRREAEEAGTQFFRIEGDQDLRRLHRLLVSSSPD